MSRHPRRTSALALLATASMLLMPATALAAKGSGGGSGGGGGGGGGTPTPTAPAPGQIKSGSSATAACDGGTNLTVSIGKGSRGQIQEVLVMSGNTAGFWTFRTVVADTGKLVVGFGGNRSELGTATSVTTVGVNHSLAPGVYDLAFTGVKNELVPGGPLDANGALLETCTASLSLVVG